MEELTIDPRFRDALPNLTNEEFKTLEQNIISDGVIKDAIVLWGDTGIILDGHHRYKIAKKHGFEFRIEKQDFVSSDDAIRWIIDQQIGKRNLSGTQRSLVRARRAALIDDTQKAASIIGVSDRQLRTDRRVAEAIESVPESHRDKVKNTASQVDLLALNSLPPDEKEEVLSKLDRQTLAEALPRPKHKLDAEHFALVKQYFDPVCVQKVFMGAEITESQVKYICSCPAVRRQLILDLAAANEKMSFAEAIDLSKRSPKKPSAHSLDITKAAEKIEDLSAKLITALDLWAELTGNLGKGEYDLIKESIEKVSPALAKIGVTSPGNFSDARQKAMKTAQALIRCVDDMHTETPNPSKHIDLLNKSKNILEGVQSW